MDDDYGLNTTVDYSDHRPLPPPVTPPDYYRTFSSPVFCDRNTPIFGSDHIFSSSSSDSASNNSEDGISAAARARIAAHPLYPKLLQAFVDCQKVGAPSVTADVFDEMLRDYDRFNKSAAVSSSGAADPELDDFMESYCDVLFKYKSDFEKPFNEATAFLNSMEMELSNLCSGGDGGVPGEATDSSEEDCSAVAGEPPVQECKWRGEDRELKEKLLHKYSGYISSLKHEFSRHTKKGKLPREARQALLDWWTVHSKWPYPTEADKVALAESTGLDQKQINNWFINQRKRHWRPSENMQFSAMGGLHGPFFSSD